MSVTFCYYFFVILKVIAIGFFLMSISSLLFRSSILVILTTLSSVHAQDFFASGSGSNSSSSGFLSNPSSSSDNILSDGSGNAQPASPSRSSLGNKRARRFQVSPYAAASIAYSDNIGLVSDNDPTKESGTIYNVGVGVNASYGSERLDAVAGVSLNQIWRSNDTDATIPAANAGVSTEIIKNFLYLDALGNVQGMRGNGLAVNSPSGASNADYEVYLQTSVSPYIRHNFGNRAVGELRYGYDYGSGTANTIGEVQSHTYTGSLGTADNTGRLNVQGSVSYTDIQYQDELNNDNDSTQLTGEVTASYALSRTLTAIGQIGYDEVEMDDNLYGEELSGEFYNVGLQYQPNSRLRLTGRVGERHNTGYYAVDGNYNLTKRAFIGVTAMTQLLTAIPLGFQGNITPGTAFDEVAEGETLASSLNNTVAGGGAVPNDGQVPFGNVQNRQLYISRSVTGYLGTSIGKGDLGIAVGYEDRDFNSAVDEIAKTATAQYRHNFTNKISGTIEGFYFGLDGLPINTQDTYGIRLLGNYAINDQVNLFASVGRTERSAEVVNGDFTEHNISAGVSTQF